MAQDVHELEILGTAAGQLLETILHFEADVSNSTSPQQDSADLVGAWQATPELNFTACLPTDYSVLGYKCRRVNNTGGPSYLKPVTGVVGTRAGVATATQVAVGLIAPYYSADGPKPRWRTSKIFMPAMAKDDIIDNRPISALQTALFAFGAALQVALTGSIHVWHYVLWSRLYSKTYSIGTLELGVKLYTLRRRLVPTL